MSPTTTPCPYCLGDIPSQALACRHCGRDVSLLLKLLAEIEELKVANATLNSSLGHLDKPEDSSPADLISDPLSSPPIEHKHTAWPLWLAGVLTVISLAFLHWLLFFIYDTPVVVFRIITFCVPIALGLWAASRGRTFWLYEFAQVLVIGMVSVYAMLHITHHLDNVPLWPQNLRDWRETIEYSLSISLALLTGLLAWRAHARWNQAKGVGSKMFLLQRDEKGHLKLEQLTTDVQQLISTVAPVVSGGMAVYSALKSLLG